MADLHDVDDLANPLGVHHGDLDDELLGLPSPLRHLLSPILVHPLGHLLDPILGYSLGLRVLRLFLVGEKTVGILVLKLDTKKHYTYLTKTIG